MERAAEALTFPAVQALIGKGAAAGFVAVMSATGNLGLVRVIEGRHGWEFAHNGEQGAAPRLIIAVRERGILIDMVAISSGNRNQWSLRRGMGYMLGLDHLNRILQERGWGADAHEVLRVYSTPMDWLAAGGNGICVLDWNLDALHALRCLGPSVMLAADDENAAKALREVMAHGDLPPVGVAGKIRHRKAA